MNRDERKIEVVTLVLGESGAAVVQSSEWLGNEGDWIDRRTLELNRRRLERSQLLETNPQVADPPDIKVVPRDEDDAL